MCEISYSVPNVGPVRIPLYPPADELYSFLRDAREVDRLGQLRHIGALEYAFPGISHTRWNYTVSMLYIITRLRRLVTNSSFHMGSAHFSSMSAALQCLALLSNIGHLPGTYCVEKGVTRFLLKRNSDEPFNSLFNATWRAQPRLDDAEYNNQVLQAANALLKERDYLALNRFLGILKLSTNFNGRVELPDWALRDLYLPFILPELRQPDPRWSEFDEYFDVARRLAYLNQDTALVDSPITVGLSPLLSNLVDPEGLTGDALVQSREILAAYEHTVYERFYHRLEARKVATVVAWLVTQSLEADVDPINQILGWMYTDGLDAVANAHEVSQRLREAIPIGSISLRSFFLVLPGSICEVETGLTDLLHSPHGPQRDVTVGIHIYVPPESQHTFDPEHEYVDAFAFGQPDAKHVARLIKWVADELDCDADDDIASMVKPEIVRIYEELFARLIEVAWPGIRLELKSWPLSRLGKLRLYGDPRSDVSIWRATPDLGDKFTQHVVRRVSNVARDYTSLRDELYGLGQLRADLRRNWQKNRSRPRRRNFLVTASVRLVKEGVESEIAREFDGGLLQLSARTGTARLYLLETKGAQTPTAAANTIKQKLETLGLKGDVRRLKSHSAYAVLPM